MMDGLLVVLATENMGETAHQICSDYKWDFYQQGFANSTVFLAHETKDPCRTGADGIAPAPRG
jgi:hypothetical protein